MTKPAKRRKRKADRLSARVTVRLTEAEAKSYKARARARHQSVGDFVRIAVHHSFYGLELEQLSGELDTSPRLPSGEGRTR